ncbi:hypothetical protein ACFXPS_00005 [Nocardia sp. NPDC059091]|uniref:hypothetical protein n=1 Tax=unclassified Nocardia TaxID=2637762 RepID=UPI00367FCB4C
MQKSTLDLSDVTFTKGAVLGPGHGYFGAQVDELLADRIPHTILVFVQGGDVYSDNLTWNVCDIKRMPDGTAAVLGDRGEFRIYAGTTLVLEKNIDMKLAGPLRGLMADTGRDVCAVGTLLQVFAFQNGEWSCRSPVVASAGKMELARRAFEHAARVSDSHMLTFGWDGEIWSSAEGQWTQADSPTSVDLLDGCSTGVGGQLAICGQAGTVVLASRDTLEVLENVDVFEDLWSICRFQGRLYCASSHLIYELVLDGRQLVPLEASDLILPTGSGHLSAAGDQALWSVGPRQLYEWDGNHWTPLFEVA